MQTTVVVIGAGQAGLSMSHWLTAASVDHVLLERGAVANSWRTERWDSLRLLTPNWLSRLPGHHYRGPDPDGYMTAAEVTAYLRDYRRSLGAPVHTGAEVTSVRATSDGFIVVAGQDGWQCQAVVVATGATGTPKVPALAQALPARLSQLAPIEYRNPAQLPDGGVLVVGGSASGVQLADELNASGREVTIAVGDHVRVPRTYRGRDIHWWMDAIGQLDERIEEQDDPGRGPRLPSLQLVGTPERRAVDLNALTASGVRITGRLVGVNSRRAQFSGSLANACASADLKMHRLLDRIDDHAARRGFRGRGGDRPAATRVPTPATELDLGGIGSVVWATGYAPRYPWLDRRLLDRRGAIRHRGGVTSQPGMYVLGLPFMRRRKSGFLDGVGADAREIADHMTPYLALRHAA
jgi:putative flavoprotein involved in K+ transport